MSGAVLATALFAASMLAVPTITKASTTFHSGVNLSVAPGGANSSWSRSKCSKPPIYSA